MACYGSALPFYHSLKLGGKIIMQAKYAVSFILFMYEISLTSWETMKYTKLTISPHVNCQNRDVQPLLWTAWNRTVCLWFHVLRTAILGSGSHTWEKFENMSERQLTAPPSVHGSHIQCPDSQRHHQGLSDNQLKHTMLHFIATCYIRNNHMKL